MNNFDELIKDINGYEEVKKYKKLESLVTNNEVFEKKYQQLTKIQQQLVNYEYNSNEKKYIETKNIYENKLNELSNNPLINEYLNAKEEVDTLIQEIIRVIENEVNNGLK